MTVTQTLREFLQKPFHLPQNIIWRFPLHPSQQPHIFVVGAPRSGTTLVKLILDAHPHLISPGYETAFFMFKDIFSFKFESFSPDELQEMRQQCRDIIEFFDQFTLKFLQKKGGSRFVEKTPPHVLRLSFLVKYFPKAQFINVVRDGRDCFCSARHHRNVVQNSHIKRYARYWKRCINARLKLGQHPNILDIKYEKLVTEPEPEIKRLMAFLQEDFDPRQLQPGDYSQNRLTRSKRPQFAQLGQPLNSTSVSRYKSELTPEEIRQFEQIAGKQLQLLGYPCFESKL